MFQIKIAPGLTPDFERTILFYLLQDDDGKTAVEGYSPTDSDLRVIQADGTVVIPTGLSTRWSALAGVPGLYTYIPTDPEINVLGKTSFKLTPTVASNVRTFVKEVLVVEQVQDVGMHLVKQNTTTKVLCYLTDDATDLIPQTGLVGSENEPERTIIRPGGPIQAAGAWTEPTAEGDTVGQGLYHYQNTVAEADTLGFWALVVAKAGVRTFIAEMQVVEEIVADPEPVPVTDMWRIPIVSEVELRAAFAKKPLIGRPKYAALRPQRKPGTAEENQDGTSIQVFEVMFYPFPDQAYTLEYRYTRRPAKLDVLTGFPQGAAFHAEMFTAACLAQAELHKAGTRGALYEHYKELLEQSVKLDEAMERETAPGIWPSELVGEADETSASTSSAPGFNLANLRRDVGMFVGDGPASQALTHIQDKRIDASIQSGYRWFVHPMVIPSLKPYVHEWSFLRPVASLSVDPDDGVTPAPPANFASVFGGLTYKDNYNGDSVVEVVGVEAIKKLQNASNNRTGRPQKCAFMEIVTQTEGVNTRSTEIIFWPEIDAPYTFEFQYTVDPFPLTNDSIVPFGSPIHAETIKYACLAAAELDIKGISGGPMFQQFAKLLEASISFDERATSPQIIAYNGDGSMGGSFCISRHCHRNSTTHEGVLYTGA